LLAVGVGLAVSRVNTKLERAQKRAARKGASLKSIAETPRLRRRKRLWTVRPRRSRQSTRSHLSTGVSAAQARWFRQWIERRAFPGSALLRPFQFGVDAADGQVQLQLRAKSQCYRIHGLDVGRVPMRTLADLGDSGLGGADQLDDVAVGKSE